MPTDIKLQNKNDRPVFPFSAIIGQEEMKLALLLNVIDKIHYSNSIIF